MNIELNMNQKPKILTIQELENLPAHRLREYHKVFKKYYFSLKADFTEKIDSGEDLKLLNNMAKEIGSLFLVWKNLQEIYRRRCIKQKV